MNSLLEKNENWKKYKWFPVNKLLKYYSKFVWLPAQNIIDTQSFSFQLCEITIDYLNYLNVT